MSATRRHVEEYLSAGVIDVSCEEVRAFCEEREGWPVTGMAVSRIAGNLGWERYREGGKVRLRHRSAAMSTPETITIEADAARAPAPRRT